MSVKSSVLVEELNRGEDGGHIDSTDTEAGSDQDADEAVLTPVTAPGVLNYPVITAGFLAITYKQDCMIKVGLADIS